MTTYLTDLLQAERQLVGGRKEGVFYGFRPNNASLLVNKVLLSIIFINTELEKS